MTLDQAINAFIMLLVVIDPVGTAPIFALLTRGGSETYRRRMAIKGISLAAGILLVFSFIGSPLLHALGVTIPAFKIAGGLLLFLLAIDMVFARQSGLRSATVREQEEARFKEDISVFPLAFPLLAGPGALTTILLLLGNSNGGVMAFASLLTIILVVLAITLLCLLAASRIMKLLGETGANVLDRLFGVILAALAVQFVIDGVTSAFFS
ncbi:MAG: MarC family protein [Gammaproteobacteria bacterium]|jgi:multiple antibiotic resistance protein